MKNTFSVFKTVKHTEAMPPVSASELIRIIKSKEHKPIVDSIRAAPDKDTRSRLKSRLPAVTASGRFSKRAASALVAHSGILIADIDLEDNAQLIESEQMRAVRVQLCADSNTHFLFESPSGGLKVGFKIEATDIDTHKNAFVSVRDFLSENYGLLSDEACKDVSRLCFLSHDPNAYYNAKSATIKTKAAKVAALPFWAPKKATAATTDGTTPGDDFNAKTDPADMLLSNGWTTRNGKQWTRPGKSGGISGTLGVTADRQFWCWSSEAAPLEPNKSYNPFALYAAFYHSGDYAAAATALAADGYGEQTVAEVSPETAAMVSNLVERALKKEADSWKAVETEIDVAKAAIEATALSVDDDFLASLDLLSASTDDNIELMKQRAKDAVFVFPEIAMMGDCTIINAGPNTGKTLLSLWLLTQRDKQATAHLKIYYINADDSFNGGIEKMEALRGEGITTLIPNQNGFDPADLSKIIKSAIVANACGRMVILLDTLKKFVSTMDKNDARVFNIMVRSFTQAGGTFIALAHTNKNKDADGKSIAEGVGDFQSDFDCAYTVDKAPVITEGAARTIVFENTKLRGPNTMKVTFEYDAGEKKTWLHRFMSIRRVGAEEAQEAADKALADAQRDKDQPVIDYILSELEDGPKSHSAITRNNLGDKTTGSVGDRDKVLDRYAGKLWGKSKGQTSGYNYHKQDRPRGNLVAFGFGG